MSVTTPFRSELSPGRDGFGQLLHAEWTKFRTVRGWIIGLIVGFVVMVGLGLFTAGGASGAGVRAGPGRRTGVRQLLFRAPAARGERDDHRPAHLDDGPAAAFHA